jgi:prephenate dehydrogenase
LAVPIRYFEQVVIECKEYFWPTTLVVDVCTIKVFSVTCLEKHLPNQPYICTHPMFGPYSYKKQWTLKDLRVVVCKHTMRQEHYQQFLSLTRLLQLTIVECSADEHDQMLARSLFLTHYVTQIVVQAELENTQIDTVSFWNLMDVVESVRNDTQLFHDVRNYNSYCKQLVEQFSLAKDDIDKKLQWNEMIT